MSLRMASPPPKPSTLGLELTEEQRKAIERLADYPRRVERLRLLWSNIQHEEFSQHRLSSSGSRSSLGRSSGSGADPRAGGGPGAQGALTARQIRELMSRELTPEDYEMLLLLDEGLKKAKTLRPEVAAALPRAAGTAWVDEACGICLCALEVDEDVRMLPGCGHCFHAPCAERWLTVEKATCPLCGREEDMQEKVMTAFKQFDKNGDGLFQISEMKQVLAALGGDMWAGGDIDSMFGCIDVNGDGNIDITEFVNWVFAVEGEGHQQRLRKAMGI